MWLVRILKQAMPTAYIVTQTDIRAPSPVRCPNARDPEGSQLTTCAMSSCGCPGIAVGCESLGVSSHDRCTWPQALEQ